MDDELFDSFAEQPMADAPESFDISEKYWLAKPFGSEEYAHEVVEKFESGTMLWDSSPFARAVWRVYRMYYNLSDTGEDIPIHSLRMTGDDGEIIRLEVNHMRNLIRHQIALVTNERGAWDPQARTMDAQSTEQVRLARNLLDFCIRDLGIERKVSSMLESALVTTHAFAALDWDANAGINGSGAAKMRVLMPYEVAHEKVREYEDCKWWIFKAWENKYEWAAFFAEADPELAEKIASGESDREESSVAFRSAFGDDKEEDRFPVLYVYAMPTRAVPGGRFSIIAGKDMVLMDQPYPFGNDVMIHRLAPAEFAGTSMPCSESWDLVPIVDAYNGVMSTIMTRVDGFGLPGVVGNDGTELSVDDTQGMQIVTTPLGTNPPTALDLLRIPPELVALLNVLKDAGELMTGINSVTRGTPADNISSGSMAALVASQSMQYNSSLERSYVNLMEAIGTSLVRLYQRMAPEGTMISICGEDSQWSMREFQGEDLNQILRVAIKTVSALAKTTAGKADIADKMLAAKTIEHPAEYLQVVSTGNVEPLFAGAVNTLGVIKNENVRMLRGEPVSAFELENHELHVREHLQLIDSSTKQRQEVLQAIQQHVMDHMNQWSLLSRDNPDALAAIGLKPLPRAAALGESIMQAQMGGPGPSAPGPGPNPVKEPGTEKQDAPKGVSAGGQQKQQGQQGVPGASNQIPGRMPKMPRPAEPK